VTSAGTTQIAFAWVRRKTGSGTLSLSVNNGTNYTDVTSMVGPAGGEYGVVYLKGAVANPTVVFKIGTSGDAFEVALFNVVQQGHVVPPHPTAAADFATTADVFSVASTKFPTAAAMSVYLDVYSPPEGIGTAKRTQMGFYSSTTALATVDINLQAGTGGALLNHRSNDGTVRDLTFGQFHGGDGSGVDAAGRLQVQYRHAENDCAVCFNGQPSWWNKLPGAISFDNYRMTPGQSLWVNRIAVVPSAVSDDFDALRLWNLDRSDTNVDANILATAFVARAGIPVSGYAAESDYWRIPGLETLYVNGDVCGIGTVVGEHQVPGNVTNEDLPLRPFYQIWEFNRATNQITAVTQPTLIAEQARWHDGLGTIMGNLLLKVKYGPYAGRLLYLSIEQESVSGELTDDDRKIYLYRSDSGDGVGGFSNKVLVADKNDFAFPPATPGAIRLNENATIWQVPDGETNAGRIYTTLNMNNQLFGFMWTDDFATGGDGTGANWSWSTTMLQDGQQVGPIVEAGSTPSLSEPAGAFWPDGTLVMTLRNTSSGRRAWTKSTDGGVTVNSANFIGGDNESASVNAGFLQADPDGLLGTYGRLVQAVSTVDYRTNHKFTSAYDADLTFTDTYRFFTKPRMVGYCPIRKPFSDDDIYVMLGETAPESTSIASPGGAVSMQLYVLRYE
jgi:hypothetical protein